MAPLNNPGSKTYTSAMLSKYFEASLKYITLKKIRKKILEEKQHPGRPDSQE